jgi:hypothetical protein
MRWERLFDDLAAAFDAADADVLEAEVADRVRGELAATSLEDRLRGAIGLQVACEVRGAGRVAGVVRQVGSGWLVVDEPVASTTIVATSAVVGVWQLPVAARSAARLGPAVAGLGLGHVLRVLARDRTPLSIALVDGSGFTGTVDRVGADYADIAEHPLDVLRRRDTVTMTRTLAFAAVAVLRPIR